MLQDNAFIEADEIHYRLYQKNIRVSLSTIYDALKNLYALGLIVKSETQINGIQFYSAKVITVN